MENVITKKDLINTISNKVGFSKDFVKSVYNMLEDTVKDNLSNANKENDVVIRLFEGVNLICNYFPEEKRINNLTGEMITIAGKIKPKSYITKRYIDKLNGIK